MKFSKIDENNRGDHYHLRADDNCLFLHEYTSGAGYKGSVANNLISNLKKKPSNRLRGDYRHKGLAIQTCAKTFAVALNPKFLDIATLVPIPGSKAEGHVDYDDRMEQICRLIRPHPALDVRRLVRQNASTAASHESGAGRVSIADLLAVYEIDEGSAAPTPKAIGIVDDVLTAGVHYRAMHTVLSRRFPGCPITGLFVARRVFAKAADID